MCATRATSLEPLSPVRIEGFEADLPPAPADGGLPDLRRLFDPEWVWQAFCERFGRPEERPHRLRLKHFLYHPGSWAVVGYVFERQWDQWIAEDQFSFELAASGDTRLFRYPEDPYLPGLPHVASAMPAHDILPKYVRLQPQRLHVEALRYRPTVRAVIRHTARMRRRSAGGATLYVRAMPPARMAQFLTAGQLAEHSGFVVPRLVGSWPEGGVVWLAKIPGKTVRALIRGGNPPDPELILDGLARLWSASPPPGDPGQSLDVMGAFGRTQRLLSQVLPDGARHPLLRESTRALRPFAESWRPSTLAHNDFYDDQIILTPDGRLALVDFEETGPGDPLMDVGNMLAQLSWMARFSRAGEAFGAYRRELRSAALHRFRWEERALALREAFSLFRLSANAVRRFSADWLETAEAVLTLVTATLAGDGETAGPGQVPEQTAAEPAKFTAP